MNNQHWNKIESEFLYYASLIRKEKEIMDALKLITAGKAALDNLKLLNQYAEEIQDIKKRGEFMRIIGQLNLELAETQMRLATQIQENVSNQEKIRNLEEKLTKSEILDAIASIPPILYGNY